MIFVTNLEMLNSAKLSFFRHPVYPDIAVAWNALFFISEANTVFRHHIPKEWSLSMFAEICLVFFLIHNPEIHNPESSQCWQTSPMPKYFQFCSSDLLTDGKFLRLYYRLYVDVWMVFKVSLPSFHARYLPHWIGCKCSSGLEFDIPRAICLSSRLFIVIKVLPTFCAIWQKLIELPSPQGKDWQTWINYVTFYHCNRFFVETKGKKLKRKILEI